MDRDFKGIWIPRNIWLSESLSLQEKILLVEINSLDFGNGVEHTNDYFSKFMGLKKTRISELINSLKNKGYLTVEISQTLGNKRVLRGVLQKTEEVLQKTEEVTSCENSISVNENSSKNGFSKKNKNSHIYNNIYNSNITNSSNIINNNNIIYNNIYIKNEKINLKFIEFISYRNESKTKLTKIGISKLVNRINGFIEQYKEEDIIQFIDTAIINGRKNIYPLTNQNNKSSNYKNLGERGNFIF